MVNEDLKKICKNLENSGMIYSIYETDTMIKFDVKSRGNDEIIWYLKEKFNLLGYDVSCNTYQNSMKIDEVDYKKVIDNAFTDF